MTSIVVKTYILYRCKKIIETMVVKMNSFVENASKYENEMEIEEHIMVCLSASPSNAKIIATAEKMVHAFGGRFSALYVKAKSSNDMSEEDHARLAYHMKLAEQAGATITTVYSEDVPYQIAEFARVSGVTKLVIGHSSISHKHPFGKPTLTEKLVEIAPTLDIHIIPDLTVENKYSERKKQFAHEIFPTPMDFMITGAILLITTVISGLCWHYNITQDSIIAVYILGVFITSVITKSYGCGIINSFASVLLFNFLFTEPRFTFHTKEIGYLFTIAIMLIVSLLTAMLASKLKRYAKESAQVAYQTRILLDTNQLLQKASDDFQMFQIATSQLMRLLDRKIVFYVEEKGRLGKEFILDPRDEADTIVFSEEEKKVAEWVLKNQKRAGAGTDIFPSAKWLYLAIRINHKVFGVVGIQVDMKPLDNFENNIVLSILDECALAIENNHNEKETKIEQLRANLLRSISHDLRTPLTTISGNADALLLNGNKLDAEVRKQMLLDIYSDSIWLNQLVENLLSATRIESGKMNLHMAGELVEEVIQEALRHVNHNCGNHRITVHLEDEFMLARMDSRLIVQVIINLVDNAIKYTPTDTEISISATEREGMIFISVTDNGVGIAEEFQKHIFEMFYTGENKIADGHRSLGLGLALCKSIVTAHGGEIILTDNDPHGSIFTFTLPKEEVELNE